MKNIFSFSLKKSVLTILFLVITSISFGQFYFGGGVNLLKGFTMKSSYLGLSLMGEKINDNHSIYANFNIRLNNKEDDLIATDINDKELDIGDLTNRYNTLELGRRNYFTDEIQYGFGYYFAEHVSISYNNVAIKLNDDIDPNLIDSELRGNILSIAVGGNAGAQYAFVSGIFFGDIGFNYIIMPFSSNILAQNFVNNYLSQLNFTLTIGFKKTLRFGY